MQKEKELDPPFREGTDDYSKANFFTKVTYSWADRLVTLMGKREVSVEELWKLNEKDESAFLLARVKVFWNEELLLPLNKRSFQRVIYKLVRFELVLVLFWQILWSIFTIVSASFFVINIVELLRSDSPVWIGVLYAFGFGLCEILCAISRNMQWNHGAYLGMHARSAAQALCYDKLTKLRFSGSFNAGQAINIIALDVQRFNESGQNVSFVFSTPFIIIAIIVIMYFEFGNATLIGFSVLFLLMPIQSYCGNKASKYRQLSAKIADRRIRLMNEILNGAKLIKLYAWEAKFAKAIADVRAEEMRVLRLSAIVESINNIINIAAPGISSLFTFSSYYFLTGNSLPAGQAFAALCLYNSVRFPLQVMPKAVKLLAEAMVGCDRMTKFLSLPEIEQQNLAEFQEMGSDGILFEARNASFNWNLGEIKENPKSLQKQQGGKMENPMIRADDPVTRNLKEKEPLILSSSKIERDTLSNITFDIKRGECLAVIGKVGASKSSLLYSLFGGLIKKNGDVILKSRKLSLVEQNPWTFNASIKQNILFNKVLDEDLYNDVIFKTAMKHDIETLSAGDATEIGERGINLSGGQKARVSLARALYSQSEIYIFDDPLSAVDAHVAKHLFHHAIRGPHMKDSAVILATHQTHFLPHVDKILALKEGNVEFYGTYSQFKEHELFKMMGLSNDIKDDLEGEDKDEDDKKSNSTPSHLKAKTEKEIASGKLVKKEERQIGEVSLATLVVWMKDLGGPIVLSFTLFFMLISNLTNVGSSWWIKQWVNNTYNDSQYFYIIGYAVFILAVAVLSFFSSLVYLYMNLRGSTRLHNRVFAKVLKGTSYFFDTTPIGRILNRFSGDLDSVDTKLLASSQDTFNNAIQSFVSIVAIAIIFPYFLIAMIPVTAYLSWKTNVFRKAIRQVKRMDSISRSPLLEHVSATISGLASVRVYGAFDRFKEKNMMLIDNSARTYYAFFQLSRWFGTKLDTVVAIISGVTALLCILLRDSLPTGSAGLALLYALQVGRVLQLSIRLLSETEAIMIAVERMHNLDVTTPQEAEAYIKEMEPQLLNWPSKAQITIEDLSVTYSSALPPVLNNVSFDIASKNHIGIGGRTGSGKSTLTLALFRMLESLTGRILIDGVDISEIGLFQLRSCLSIIPQTPTLFIGTVRSNLDPFNDYEDTQIWKCLEQVQLKDFISNLPLGLNSLVAEGGTDYSVGQRQLFCFCRALLRDSKIIIMDEATSNIDLYTDDVIQHTIAEAFSDKTLIIVAHRLNTIIKCNKILMLGEGKVLEYGAPDELLKNKDGVFSSLVDQTGEEHSQHLRKMALECRKDSK